MVQHSSGGMPRSRLERDATVEGATTPEGAARAALDQLRATLRVERAAVVLEDEGGRDSRVITTDPRAGEGPTASQLSPVSGAIVTIPLLSHGRRMGLLSFTLEEPDGLSRPMRDACNQLATRLAEALTRLDERQRRDAFEAEIDRRVAARVEATRERLAALERANDRLTERNAELEQFVHSASHDLLSPVRTMRSAAEALADALEVPWDASAVHREAERVLETASRLGRLVGDLVAYNRLGESKPPLVPTRLDEVVDEALAQLRSEIEHAGARITVAGPLPSVRGHHGSLVQAVMNLLGNATKFTAPGVVPEVAIGCEVAGGQARLLIRDNGIGVPAAARDRIFQAFERLHGDDAYSGSGLGLAIVKRLVCKMGGRVGVAAETGGGSTFFIELPLLD